MLLINIVYIMACHHQYLGKPAFKSVFLAISVMVRSMRSGTFICPCESLPDNTCVIPQDLRYFVISSKLYFVPWSFLIVNTPNPLFPINATYLIQLFAVSDLSFIKKVTVKRVWSSMNVWIYNSSLMSDVWDGKWRPCVRVY